MMPKNIFYFKLTFESNNLVTSLNMTMLLFLKLLTLLLLLSHFVPLRLKMYLMCFITVVY